MVNEIRKNYPCGLNKGFSSVLTTKFEKKNPEEIRKLHQLKCCKHNNKDKDEDNSSKKKKIKMIKLHHRNLDKQYFIAFSV